MISFCRLSTDRKKCLLFHFNFSPVSYPKHRIGALCKGTYHQILNSDDAVFGGTGNYPSQVVKADPIPWDGKEYSVEFDVPPYSVSAFSFSFPQPAAPRRKTVKEAPPVKGTVKSTKPLTKKQEERLLKAFAESGKSLKEVLELLKK